MKYIVAILGLCAAASAADLIGAQYPLAGPAGVCPEFDGECAVYLLDLKNRFVFYECANGQPILQYCNDGLVFSPKNNTCDYPQSRCGAFGPVGQCPDEDCGVPTFLRDGVDMSVMYMCRDGQAVALNCDDDLLFDPYKNSCVVGN